MEYVIKNNTVAEANNPDKDILSLYLSALSQVNRVIYSSYHYSTTKAGQDMATTNQLG